MAPTGKNRNGYAVAVFVETPQGIPLVRDPSKPLPHFWKFPGGRSEANETPSETAARELKEETGIDVPSSSLQLLCEDSRDTHSFFLFRARTDQNFLLSPESRDGEFVQYFAREKISGLPDFFPCHHALFERYFFPH